MSDAIGWASRPAGPIRGDISIPGDKSISHRAIMLASIAEGTSRISGFLEGEDTRATAAVFRSLGVSIDAPRPSQRIVHGVGLHGLAGAATALDCGNSGTGMRLLTGLLAGQAFDSKLVGDESLSRRPMRRVIEPLAAMGASITAEAGDFPPLSIRGRRELRGIRYAPPIASAQVKSAVLLAGLYAHGDTEIEENHPTRDYTERMLAAFGWPIVFAPGRTRLSGGHRLRAMDVDVPADFSSAAFFVVAAALVPGSELCLKSVGLNPRRTGLLRVLRAMGADIREERQREQGGERVADLIVRYAPLRGVDVPAGLVSDMIDEFPILFIAAAAARGTTTISGAAELRAKESDRIATMVRGLRALGIRIAETPGGAVIDGGSLAGGDVDSAGDHRIAMSFAVAGIIAKDAVHVADCANVATSFPGFLELANSIGFAIDADGC